MRILYVVFFALLYVVGTGLSFFPVYGHASPVTYDPSPNKVFDSPQSLPDKVTISFTERPEVKASSIKVFTSDNKNNQAQNSQIMPNVNGSTGYSKNFTTADNIVLKFKITPFSVGQN